MEKRNARKGEGERRIKMAVRTEEEKHEDKRRN